MYEIYLHGTLEETATEPEKVMQWIKHHHQDSSVIDVITNGNVEVFLTDATGVYKLVIKNGVSVYRLIKPAATEGGTEC